MKFNYKEEYKGCRYYLASCGQTYTLYIFDEKNTNLSLLIDKTIYYMKLRNEIVVKIGHVDNDIVLENSIYYGIFVEIVYYDEVFNAISQIHSYEVIKGDDNEVVKKCICIG